MSNFKHSFFSDTFVCPIIVGLSGAAIAAQKTIVVGKG